MSGKFSLSLCFIEVSVFNAHSQDPDLWRIIWVYSVCQCSFYWTLGISVLTFKATSFYYYYSYVAEKDISYESAARQTFI